MTSAIRLAILQALGETESYGLEIIDRARAAGHLETLTFGNVYPALRDLERDGILESWEGEEVAARGGRPRRYYRLTAAGREELGRAA